ncbi:MAG TPA: acyl carrier protein [Clostridiales bacterium]|jgi:acyl carrier protein|nr:acyl carrier protein [Clostridiales bacterium]
MIFNAIVKLIAEHNDCDVSEITMDTTFQSLSIDSLDTVELLMNLEDVINRQIELDQKVSTVGDLVRLVEAKCQE